MKDKSADELVRIANNVVDYSLPRDSVNEGFAAIRELGIRAAAQEQDKYSFRQATRVDT